MSRRRFIQRNRSGSITINPIPGEYLLDETNVTSAVFPTWDDSQGTIYLDDGNGNKRAMSWADDGFYISHNGSVLEQYPPAWADPPHTPGTTYYVKNGGSDGAAGTSDGTAWATVAKVVSYGSSPGFNAGDAILFKCGSTWSELLTIPRSGTSGNFMKFGSYDTGAAPIIDAGGARSAAVQVATKNYVWIDGLDLKSATFANLYLSGDECTNVTVTNCTMRDAVGSGGLNGYGVHVEYSTNFRIKDCVINDNSAAGLQTYGWRETRHSGVVIAFNNVYNNGKTATGSETQNSRKEQMNFIGPWLTGVCYGNTLTSPSGAKGWLPIYFDREAETVGSDNRFFNNTFVSLGTGGSSASLWKSPCAVYRNVQYSPSLNWGFQVAQANGKTVLQKYHHNITMENVWGGHTVQASDAQEVSGGHFQIYSWNNVFDKGASSPSAFDTGEINFQNDDTPTLSLEQRHFKNNIVSNSGGWFVKWTANFTGGQGIDYNLYYSSAKGASAWTYAGATKTFATWQTAGHDTNGVNGSDPLFNDNSSAYNLRDYGLQSGSPATGAAGSVYYDSDPNSWIGFNFAPHAAGSADIGAHQYNSGKTWYFDSLALGLTCAGGTAARIAMEATAQPAATLNAWTGA